MLKTSQNQSKTMPSTKSINWGKVLYNEDEKRLVFFDQKVVRIPEAVINLFHDRVRVLDLSNNKIHDLSNLVSFSNLEELILDNNMITESVQFPHNSPKLRVLSMNNNRIKNIEPTLRKIERCFPQIEYLSLLGNTACPYFFLNFDFDSYYEYRLHVISHLRRLKFLDSKRVTQIERDMAASQQNPAHTQTDSQSAPTSLTFNNNNSAESTSVAVASTGLFRFWPWKREPKVYTPLPESKARNPRSAYGKLNYKYIGKDSEGNRFIMNSDL